MTARFFTSYKTCGCSDLREHRSQLASTCPLHGDANYSLGVDPIHPEHHPGLPLGFATLDRSTGRYNTPTLNPTDQLPKEPQA